MLWEQKQAGDVQDPSEKRKGCNEEEGGGGGEGGEEEEKITIVPNVRSRDNTLSNLVISLK